MSTNRSTLTTVVFVAAVAALSGCTAQPNTTSPSTGATTPAVASSTPATEVPAVQVSLACASALEEMRQGYDALYALPTYSDQEANALELPPLDACRTAAEYIEGVRQNPAALGLTRASAVDPEIDLGVRCSETFPEGRATAVCADAIAQGIVP